MYRLVHEAKSNLGVALVLSCDLRPKTGKLGVSGTTLTDNRAVPTSIIVNVNDTKGGTGAQAALDELVVGREVGRVKVATKVVVEKELPSDGQSESVQAIVVDEVLHLGNASLTRVDDACCLAGSIDATAEVETCDLSHNHGQMCSKRNGRRSTHVGASVRNASGAGSTASAASRSRAGCWSFGGGGRSSSGRSSTGQALGIVLALALASESRYTGRRAGPAITTTLAVGRALGVSRTTCCRRSEGEEDRLHVRLREGCKEQAGVKEVLSGLVLRY
jgi:hypothetical protein